jgi:MFS family permease
MALAGRISGWKGQVAPIAAISLFGLSMTMSYPLYALLLERAGASGTVIGLNTMAAAVSMVAFAPVMPALLNRFGMGPLMVSSALIISVVFAAIPVFESIAWWMVLRFVYGFAATALFFASEFWIVGAAPDERRGRIIAIYGVSLSAAFAAGPLLLRFTGFEGWTPFLVAAAIPFAGIAAILWGLSAAPPIDREERPRLADTLRFYVSDPTMIWAVFLFACVEYGTLALLTVWGVRSGLVETDAVLLVSLFAFGAMLCQLPIGWAADRFDHRRLLVMAGIVALVAPLAALAAGPALALLVPVMLIWGGMATGLYSVALTALGSRYSGERLAKANAAVVLAYGLGALASPPVLGLAMDALDPDGLLVASAGFAAAYLALALARMVFARKSP